VYAFGAIKAQNKTRKHVVAITDMTCGRPFSCRACSGADSRPSLQSKPNMPALDRLPVSKRDTSYVVFTSCDLDVCFLKLKSGNPLTFSLENVYASFGFLVRFFVFELRCPYRQTDRQTDGQDAAYRTPE